MFLINATSQNAQEFHYKRQKQKIAFLPSTYSEFCGRRQKNSRNISEDFKIQNNTETF
jgi:hypothetical protein